MRKGIAEVVLRNTYNRLWRRRNPQFMNYDVFNVNRLAAKTKFKILAEKLIRERIDPKFYLLVLSNYGKWDKSNSLPPPAFLASDKAIEVFRWLSEKEQKKYFNKTQLKYGLEQGLEISRKEVLGRLRADAKAVSEIEVVNRIRKKDRPAFFTGIWGTVSPWYVALHSDFIGSEFFDRLTPQERSEVHKCKAYFRTHLRTRKRAFEIIREEQENAKAQLAREARKEARLQRLIFKLGTGRAV